MRGAICSAKLRLGLGAAVLACMLPAQSGSTADGRHLLERISASGRLDAVGVSSSDRLQPMGLLVPGDPPLLAFRYLEDRRRHRFGELDLMMDDAGH